ncbi:unnamed protein product [Blepharisma stoltei]|uniref:Uncharacterized protein n=1 Tax=Blepharisma stoltei TaxID=1481888 RepID=A0AAU9JJG5_9CILI|nr:unnamed protein product [Blepharisma stoltei]
MIGIIKFGHLNGLNSAWKLMTHELRSPRFADTKTTDFSCATAQRSQKKSSKESDENKGEQSHGISTMLRSLGHWYVTLSNLSDSISIEELGIKLSISA